MIIYNITCSMDPDISEGWLKWMKEFHIPDVMQCGIFQTAKINKVISEKEEISTYAIQYSCHTMKDLHKYQAHFANKLQKEHAKRYGNKVDTFRTLLEVIDSFE